MKRTISLKNIRLRQIVTSLLVILTFFVSTAFDIHGNQLQAQAEPVTPEANKYQVERTANDLANDAQQAGRKTAEKTQAAGNNLFDTIREKLNLDEPIDPGTKQAGEQLKDAASNVTKSTQRAVEDTTDSTKRAVRDTTRSTQQAVKDATD